MSHTSHENARDAQTESADARDFEQPRWKTEKWSRELPHHNYGVEWRLTRIRGKKMKIGLFSFFVVYPVMLFSILVLAIIIPFEIVLAGGELLEKIAAISAALVVFFAMRLIHVLNEISRNLDYQTNLLVRVYDSRELEENVHRMGLKYRDEWKSAVRPKD